MTGIVAHTYPEWWLKLTGQAAHLSTDYSRDGAYKGVYSRKVLGDFKNIKKTEEVQKYLSLDWKTGKVHSV